MRILLVVLIIFVNSIFPSQKWENISPFPESSYGVFGDFVSADKGWVHKGTDLGTDVLYYTGNGGLNWDVVYTLEDSLESFISLTMIDSLHGWASKIWQNNQYPNNSLTYYLKTSDGGYNWVDMTGYFPNVFEAYSFNFIDKDIGFFCSGSDSLTYNALIYKTTDGGYNWYLTETPAIYDVFPYYSEYIVNKFFFLDEYNGWAACSVMFDSGLSLYTSDGGDTWVRNIQFDIVDVFDIHFINPLCGGAVGRNASFTRLVMTEDNFETTTYDYSNSSWNQLAETICYQNDSTVWVTGDPGIINRSKDCGRTFESFQIIDARLKDIQFFKNTGYIFGSNNNALYKFVDTDSIEDIVLPNDSKLYQNYPNPFNNQTIIEYQIQDISNVRIDIYNTKGQFIQNLIDKKQNIGKYVIEFNGIKLNSGVYYYKMKIDGDIMQIKKMLYLQ